jgi:DNA-binding response OmpR family regulator
MAQRILFVEDDAAVRWPLSQVLMDAGFEVVAESDPLRAIDVLDGPSTIDLMITDVHLPTVNGVTLVRMARVKRQGMPVLFMTGGVLTDLDADGVRVLRKPFRNEQFLREVREVIAHASCRPDLPS